MTITSLETRNEYTAVASQTVFNYTFKIFESTDLNVYQTPAGNTPNCSADLITGYTVSGVGDEDGGYITLNTGASAGDLITIVSNIDQERTTDYQNNGDFRPDTVNADFDRVVSLVKQISEKTNRAPIVGQCYQGVSPLALPVEAGKGLVWNSAGTELETADYEITVGDVDGYTVRNYTSLKALTGVSDNEVAIVLGRANEGDGGGGKFYFDSSDLSTEVTADTQAGLYVPPNSDPTGASGAWVRLEYFENGYVKPAWFEAAGDGSTDDYAKIQAMVDLCGYVIWEAGKTYALSDVLTVTRGPIVWRGVHSGTVTSDESSTPIHSRLKATGSQTEVVSFEFTSYEANESVITDMGFISNNATSDQHGLVFKSIMMRLTLERVTFNDITGYGIAWDPTESNYCQNLALRDVRFFNIGGCIGLTAEPSASAAYLACTLITLDNVNLDNSINSVSPQDYVYDFRAIREVHASNLLTEGSCAVAMQTVIMAVGPNSWYIINGWHNEWTGTYKPTYTLSVIGDTSNKFFGDQEASITINELVSSYPIQIQDSTEPIITINGWDSYYAADTSDLVDITHTISGKNPTVSIHGLYVKNPFLVDDDLRGWVTIHDYTSRDSGGSLYQGPTKIASWRPSDGDLDAFTAAYLAPAPWAASIASDAIEADTTNTRINVHRFTSNVGYAPTINFYLYPESAWIGSLITVVMRYYMEVDSADLDKNIYALYNPSSTTRSGTATKINCTGVYNQWATAVLTYEPNATPTIPTSTYIGTAPTVAVILRVAAIDVYIGSKWNEPLDLEHP